MTFPVYFDCCGLHLHPHFVLESLGYFAGARLFFYLRRRDPSPTPPLALETQLWVLVGCVFGAWLGSKLLAWAESPALYWSLRHDLPALWGGKTIVGGLLGGWAGVELAKHRLGLRQSTGDLFVYPLALGTAIGRLGCFFSGLDDRTYGLPSTLPWAVDFGDGLPRHPTQLYESAYVLLLALGLWWVTRRRRLAAGLRFQLYFAGYFGFRFTVEFFKPREFILPALSMIQLSCLCGIFLTGYNLRRLLQAPVAALPNPTSQTA